MHRRTLLKALGSGALICMCDSRSWAQKPGSQVLPKSPLPGVLQKPPIIVTPPAMRKPFCDFSRPANGEPGGVGIQSYDLKPNGGRPKTQLTWSFTGPLEISAPPNAAPAAEDMLKLAFAAWNARDAAPALSFVYRSDPNEVVDIAIKAFDLGAPDANGLQTTGSTEPDGTLIKLTNSTKWTPNSLWRTATHEIGHALGLLHMTTTNSMMYPIDQGLTGLGPDDKAAIRALYGWSAQTQIEGGSVAAPALAACGNTLVRAWRGTGDDQNIWISTSTDGTSWTPQRPIPGAASAVGPALAWDGSQLWMAWRGINDDYNLYWASTSDFFTRYWTGVQRLGDRASSHTPRIAFAAGSMVMAWKGIPGDQGLYYARSDGNWGEPHKIDGVGSACAPAICQDVDSGAVRMVWRGVNDDQNLYTSTLSAAGWQPQKLVSWVTVGNGAEGITGVHYPGTADSPSVAYIGDKVLLAWRGVDGDSGLYFTQLTNDVIAGSTVPEWSGQAKIPNVGSSNGPSIDAFNGSLHAVWKGVADDHALWTAML